MKILDFHIHISETTQIQEVISFMDRLGISKGAILSTNHGPQGVQRGTNVSWQKAVELMRRSNGRLYAIGSAHPDGKKEPAAEFEEMLLAGIKGCKLYPHSGFYPNDARLDEMYALAQEREIPVLIHTGVKAHKFQQIKYNAPIYVDDVAAKFPKLKIVLMHAGYPWVDEALMIARLNDNVTIDLTFLDVLEYTFCPGLTESVMQKCMRIIGDDKLVWGSEGEWLGLSSYRDDGIGRVETYLNKIRAMSFLSAGSQEKILYKNAARLINAVEDMV